MAKEKMSIQRNRLKIAFKKFPNNAKRAGQRSRGSANIYLSFSVEWVRYKNTQKIPFKLRENVNVFLRRLSYKYSL